MSRYAIMDDNGIIEESSHEDDILAIWNRLGEKESFEEVLGVEVSGDLKFIEIKDCMR